MYSAYSALSLIFTFEPTEIAINVLYYAARKSNHWDKIVRSCIFRFVQLQEFSPLRLSFIVVMYVYPQKIAFFEHIRYLNKNEWISIW